MQPPHLYLVVVTLAAMLSHVVPAAAQPSPSSFRPSFSDIDQTTMFVAEASRRFGVPVSWITAVMRVESAGDAMATSPVGAIGLMQVMPQTYAALRVRLGLGANPYDPHDNIMAGAAYLRDMYDRHGSAGFLAAYNAGPNRWEDYLAGVRPLPDETVRYLNRLAPIGGVSAPMVFHLSASRAPRLPKTASLFAALDGERMALGPPPIMSSFRLHAAQEARTWTSGGLFAARSPATVDALSEQAPIVAATAVPTRARTATGVSAAIPAPMNPLFVPPTRSNQQP